MFQKLLIYLAILFIVLGILVGVTALIVDASRHGNHVRSQIQACHSLGPEYHYWQERSRCVKYINGR